MELFITLVNGEKVEQAVDKDICIIGRSIKCDVVIPHEGMSRHHCQIENMNGEVFITDLGSTNGVLIDGKKIEPHVRTPYQTYLSLSFGAVQSLVLSLEGNTIKQASQTDNTTHHRANLTRTVTRSMTDPKVSADATRHYTPSNKPQTSKAQMWMINILAALILGGAVYWYTQNEEVPGESVDDSYSAPSPSKPEETIDRF